MNLNLPKNTKFLVFGIIALIIVLLVIAFLPRRGGENISFSPLPQPTQRPFYLEPGYNGPSPGSVSQTSTPESEEAAGRSEILGELLNRLPFEGQYFSLNYDFSTNAFTATFNSKELARANREFDEFLKQNNVPSRDWLYNLKISRI